MIKIIISMIEIEVAKTDYLIELNNYKCNQEEKPSKDFITDHHYYRDKMNTLRDIQQKINQLWENI